MSQGDSWNDPMNSNEYYARGGKLLASPPPGEEVVISGMAGVFPNTSDIYGLRDNLFNKVDMVTPNRRWDYAQAEVPSCSGTILEVDKYDSGFFGVHERQSHSMDAMARILQEKAVEAIFDAGLHPSELEGTKTGVYVGVCFSDSEKAWYFDNLDRQMFALTGTERSMIAHRLSYFLKLKGPSCIMDTACSSSGFALENAYRAIRLGEIETAIVGGTNLCLYPFLAMQFLRLGALSKDGHCKTFDAKADGYTRSEGVVAIVLQKAKNAKRIYAEVVHARTNCDGFKERSITYPSKEAQMSLLTDLFEDCGIDKFSLSFVETHGTGTKAGDSQECAAIDAVLTSGRKSPLLIGSVKSNTGHTESTSGVCSIVKCVLAMETGYIPPNINYQTTNPVLTGIVEGRMKVVADKIALEDNNAIMGVNNFGMGGGNAHILLRRNPKKKIDYKNNLPRLVCVSGRTEEAVTVLLNQFGSTDLDVEYIKLLHEVFRKNIENHLYRGYAVLSPTGRTLSKSLGFCAEQGKPLHIVFSELDNWYEIGKQLITLPVFSDSIQRIQKSLTVKGTNISNVLLNGKLTDGEGIPIVGAVVVQIAIVHLLDLVGLTPSSTSGYSAGELTSAYCNKILTLEETLNYAVVINGILLNNNQLSRTSICKDNQIERIEKCDRSRVSIDINEIIQILEKELWESGDVNWDNKADILIHALKRNRNLKYDKLQENSVVLEIGGCSRTEIEDVPIVTLFKNRSTDHVIECLATLGSLYVNGQNPQISNLYPPVDLPVSRSTPMISPYIRWKHTREKFVPQYSADVTRKLKHGIRSYTIEMADEQWAFLKGHIIDGMHVFPATGYLYMVWETFIIKNGIPLNTSRVSFENCSFIKATTIPEKGSVIFTVCILNAMGTFEILESNSIVATGRITFLPDSEKETCYSLSSDLTKSQDLQMNKRDVYKELRLRGYNYRGQFQSIEECDTSISKAQVQWRGNWTVFMDNMLQLRVLQGDTRSLNVTTFISKLNVAADTHLDWIKRASEGLEETIPNLPVYCDRSTGRITCGGITISGQKMTSVIRKENQQPPVLEKYDFVPNFAQLDLRNSVTVNIQIIIEHTLMQKFKAVELIDEFTDAEATPLLPVFKLALQNEPLVQPSLKILSSKVLDLDVDVENRKLRTESDCLLVIASKILQRPDTFKSALTALKENAFILSRESNSYDITKIYANVTVATVHKTPYETLVLLQKQSLPRKTHYVEVNSTENFSWLGNVQTALREKSEDDIVLYVEKDPTNGIVGFMRCLRKEPGYRNVRCVFIMDEDEEFDPNRPIYENQLKRNMAFNVYKNGQWGTFRHVQLEDSNLVNSEHRFLNIKTKGDLSTLQWVKGGLRHGAMPEPGKELVNVYYAAINSRDVVLATGRANNSVGTSRLEQDPGLGYEFSGRDQSGNRVMGAFENGALANLLMVDRFLLYQVPDAWTLEEAATVPLAYSIAIYALIMCGDMKKGETILIHDGAGDIGQAAINLALYYGLRVFTFINTEEKREFIKETYPQLNDENIGNYNDDAFEQVVYKGTNGRGVDIVLGSIKKDKFTDSIRCLATNGRFLQVGQFDLVNAHLNLLLFKKQASFHKIALDNILNSDKLLLRKLFTKALEEGAIKPLYKSVFECDEVEAAFRFATAGTHIGKVLVEIRASEELPPPSGQSFICEDRYSCDPQGVYFIVGGLGGIGLELADWLILRGARKIMLSSRRGVTTGYQQYKIKLWQSYGVIVKITNDPLTKMEGCRQVLSDALQLGRISAIFNLAVATDHAVFENQTPKSFTTTFEPKVVVTKNLDVLTRTMCRDLKDFVAFSSFSCGRGNIGVTNYGMANSAMERICGKRKMDGFPGLAIQWGPVGEVGLLAETQEENSVLEIGGAREQSISSCLQTLDTLLTQKDAAVLSSTVVAQKYEQQSSDNVVSAILNVIGLRDAKYVSLHSSLTELGMDSMIAIEIKLILERNFEIYLSAKDMGTVTLARLKEIQEEKHKTQQDVGNEKESLNDTSSVTESSGNSGTSKYPKIILFPTLDGFSDVFKNLSKDLKDASILQYVPNNQTSSVMGIVSSLLPAIEQQLQKDQQFTIVAYSYGVLVALEVVHVLESRGYTGTVICIDGAPLLLKQLIENLDEESEKSLHTDLLCQLLLSCIPKSLVSQNKDKICKCETWDEKVNFAVQLVRDCEEDKTHVIESATSAIYSRINELRTYEPSYRNLNSNIRLLKATDPIVADIEDDYGLSQLLDKAIELQFLEGNHRTILKNKHLADAINLLQEVN